jgi:hypothetical protein
MSFRYTTGLQNVGSYQVSGHPWLKSASFTGVESKFYEFANVTDYIKITNDVAAAGTGNLDIVFCEPRTGLDMPNDEEYFETSGLSLTEFTVSFWLKGEPGISRVIEFDDQTAVIIRPSGANALGRLIVENGNTIDSVTFAPSEWNFITITVGVAESKIYINGANPATVVSAKTTTVTELYIGTDRLPINSDAQYDDMSLFSIVLNSDEVLELYNSTSLSTLLNHSKVDKLISFWDFENNTYKTFYSNPDDGRNVYDRISENHLSWNAGGSAAPADATYISGRILDTALSHHKITLEGEQEIRLNCKSKQVFLRSTGTTNVNVSAGLTGIPASRMYELTGPGIDE